MNPASIPFRRDQFLVGILDRDRPAAEVVKGDPQTLANVFGSTHGIFGVITNLLEKAKHGSKGVKTSSGTMMPDFVGN